MKFLILGGTGTLGQALARELLKDSENFVTCVSRCELKQKQMAADFEGNPNLRFYLGDVRDRDAMFQIVRDYDAVFHVAALKHVDVLEDNPEESVKTNVLGTIHVADAAQAAKIPFVVFSSTDKAVEPINAYGMCKGISEKILLKRNRSAGPTKFVIYRWGNVAASRGSAIPAFVEALKNQKPVPITDFGMTRFWIKIEEAARFVLSTYMTAPWDEVMIPPIKAAPITAIVKSLEAILGVTSTGLKKVPIRAGEKIHESIRPGLTSETAEHFSAEELTEFLKGCV